MLTPRQHLWAWALLALAIGAFLTACFGTIDSPASGLDLALLLPVLFLGLVVTALAGRHLPVDEPRFELDPLLTAAPCRAPPA